MRWLMFTRRHESAAAAKFAELLDEVIEDFDKQVELHKSRLESLREALRDG